ncbi:MAG: hypothetical protein WCA06_05570, partial [Terrimicrobiaceae bacterium]
GDGLDALEPTYFDLVLVGTVPANKPPALPSDYSQRTRCRDAIRVLLAKAKTVDCRAADPV